MTVRHIKHWCPNCDAAILSGTICPVCQTDIGKEMQQKAKKRKDDYSRKNFIKKYSDPQFDD